MTLEIALFLADDLVFSPAENELEISASLAPLVTESADSRLNMFLANSECPAVCALWLTREKVKTV